MKKRFVALMLVLACLCAHALAAGDPIKINIELSETRFSAPEEITVTVQVTNTGDTETPGSVRVYYPGGKQVEAFGEPVLKAGQSKTCTFTWQVTQKQLDSGKIVIPVKYPVYGEDGELRNKTKNMTVLIIYVPGETEDVTDDSGSLTEGMGAAWGSFDRADDLLGTWVWANRITGDEATLEFEADGSCRLVTQRGSASGRWYIDGNTIMMDDMHLTIVDGELHVATEGGSMVFVRPAEKQPLSEAVLGEWVWRGTMENGRYTISAEESGISMTMTFREDGMFVMSSGGEDTQFPWIIRNGELLIGGLPGEIIGGEMHVHVESETLVLVRGD